MTSKFTISYSESNACSSLVPKKRKKKPFFQKCHRLLSSMSDECKFFGIWGNKTFPPPYKSVLTLHHRKKEKKCQATSVRSGSSKWQQLEITDTYNLCHSELLNTQIATKNLLKRVLRGPYSQLLLPPCRRETRVVADLRMTSASRAGEVGIKSSSFLLSSLGLLEGEGSVSLSALRRGFFDGWYSAEVVGEVSLLSTNNKMHGIKTPKTLKIQILLPDFFSNSKTWIRI